MAAIINRYYNWAHPNSLVYLRWYVGEVATAVYVVNVPACWPLLRKVFKLDNWSKNRTVAGDPMHATYSRRSSNGRKIRSVFSIDEEMPKFSESEVHLAEVHGTRWDANEESVPTWPLCVHHTRVNATRDGYEELDVHDGAIVKTIEVSQQRVMRPGD